MKLKIVALLLGSFGLFMSSAHAADGTFGYTSVDYNGVLASVNGVYYELSGVRYPIDALPDDVNFCSVFGFNVDGGEYSGGGGGPFSVDSFPAQLVLSDWSTKTLASGTEGIGNVFCSLAENATPSQHYQQKIVNADATVTFIEPRFVMNGQEIGFVPDAGKEGVCMVFGMHSINSDATSEYYTQIYDNPTQSQPLIYFDAFDYSNGSLYHQTGLWSTALAQHRISSVTCKN